MRIIGIVAVTLAAGSALGILARTTDSGPPSSSSVRGAYVEPLPGSPGSAHDFATLVANADAIVIADVTESSLGRSVGPAGEPPVTFVHTQLAVGEILGENRTDLANGSSIALETDYHPADAESLAPVGTRVLVFLWLKRDGESAGQFYRPLTANSVFSIDDARLSSLRTGGQADAPVADEVAEAVVELSLEDLRRTVQRARP
jgi:hypothetical protein